MEINFTTFLLEILNFLVLVYILKRFFYRPILNVVNKRKSDIANTLENANQRLSKAQKLQEKYNSRLEEWSVERKKRFHELDDLMALEKKKRLDALNLSLIEKKKANDIAREKEMESLKENFQRQALENATLLVSHLLGEFSDTHLDDLIVEMVCKTLKQLDSNKNSAFVSFKESRTIALSARELSEKAKMRLKTTLGASSGDIKFDISPDLLGGIELQSGDMTLKASLKEELAFFAQGWSHD